MTNNLTACLLVYNHSHVLKETIDSIRAQSYSHFNLIISDDCSTDNSFEIAQEYETNNKNILALRTPHNMGMAGNCNFAARFVKSEYFAILHHDDLLEKDCFQKWINKIEEDDEISFVFNDYRHGQRISHRDSGTYFPPTIDGKKFLTSYLLTNWGSPVRGTTLIRKSFFDKIGGMDVRFGMLADVDLWMRLGAISKIGYVPEPLISVRHARLDNYPEEYHNFTWKRILLLFDIHANNINRDNYPDFLIYKLKIFIFRNKVSFEIIKWHIYALVKSKMQIIISFPEKCEHEYFYSKVIRSIIKMLPAL